MILRLLRTERVRRELNLSNEQKHRLQELLDQNTGASQRRQNSPNLSKEQSGESRKMGDRAAQRENAIEAILLPGQVKRLKQIVMQHRNVPPSPILKSSKCSP